MDWRKIIAEESAEDLHPARNEDLPHRRRNGEAQAGLALLASILAHVLKWEERPRKHFTFADRARNQVAANTALGLGPIDDIQGSESAADAIELGLDVRAEAAPSRCELPECESDPAGRVG